MEQTYAQQIAEAITQYLDDDKWNYSFDEKTGVYSFQLSMSEKIKKIAFLIEVRNDAFIVYGTSPIGAEVQDTEMMAQMMEFVCRANYGLRFGNFEFDLRDGEIRFKYAVDCDGIVPSRAMISNSICLTAAMFERYSPGIVGILFTGMNALEAINLCETH